MRYENHLAGDHIIWDRIPHTPATLQNPVKGDVTSFHQIGIVSHFIYFLVSGAGAPQGHINRLNADNSRSSSQMVGYTWPEIGKGGFYLGDVTVGEFTLPP